MKFTQLRELPDQFFFLARCDMGHVRFVMFHSGMLAHEVAVLLHLIQCPEHL